MPKMLDLDFRLEIQDASVQQIKCLMDENVKPFFVWVEVRQLGLEGLSFIEIRKGSDLWKWLEQQVKDYLLSCDIDIRCYQMRMLLVPSYYPNSLPQIQFAVESMM